MALVQFKFQRYITEMDKCTVLEINFIKPDINYYYETHTR